MLTDDYISLVMVSRNRADYLLRGLHYLRDAGFRGEVFVGDASAPPDAKRIAGLADGFRGTLRLSVTAYGPATPLVTRLVQEFEKVRTPMCAWMGDDDFLFPHTLRGAAHQLEGDAGGFAIVGKSLLFENSGATHKGTVTGLGPYLQRPYADASAAERLNDFAVNPSALTYALKRTAATRRIYREIAALELPDDIAGYHFFEFMDAMLAVIEGKVLSIDRLMMLRQTHDRSTSGSGGLLQQWSHIVDRPSYRDIRARCVRALSDALEKTQGRSGEDPERIATAALDRCLQRTADRALARERRDAPPAPPRSIAHRLKSGVRRVAPVLARRLGRARTLQRLRADDRAPLRRALQLIECGSTQMQERADIQGGRT